MESGFEGEKSSALDAAKLSEEDIPLFQLPLNLSYFAEEINNAT